ncbi:hypothetical protein VN0773_00820 [Helicobacter pylori]|nr:hypothetical protein VN0227_12400 [Helicobacter pylori]GHP56287.1 hypothetical protein VN1192_12570 [Helicobacter pylori]GHP86335.1 hypothetical protein VN0246_09230 [Helicobacter pylori]GHR11395.1 hypothetical protein VN1247_05420 [Helicobacter pylori]
MIALSDALLYMAAPRQVAKKLTFKEGSLKFQIKSFKHDIMLKISKPQVDKPTRSNIVTKINHKTIKFDLILNAT